MAKMVGLSRNLKLPWLNKAAELCSSDLTEQEIKDQLNEYLSFEITSPTNLRKTREILMKLWFYMPEGDDSMQAMMSSIRNEGLRLIGQDPDNAIPAHWCQLLVTYPVFADLSRLIGKMFEFDDVITMAQVKRKLFDEWGERTTLYHSVDKLIATLKAIDVLESPGTGKYTVKRHNIRNATVAHHLLHTMIVVDQRAYYRLPDLTSSVYLFPFTYKIKKDELLNDQRFSFNTFGGELTMGIDTSHN